MDTTRKMSDRKRLRKRERKGSRIGGTEGGGGFRNKIKKSLKDVIRKEENNFSFAC